MEIIKRLADVRVAPTTDRSSFAYSTCTLDVEHPVRVRRRSIAEGTLAPLVSCLMVTRGDRWTIRYAIECYRRQTYENRELIIAVNANNHDIVSEVVGELSVEGVTLVPVDPALTLGDCRNMSISHARGDVLMQWDDDDLYDPLRIAVSVSALIKTASAAAVLSRWLVWWPSRDLAAISGRRLWEGSIAVWRDRIPVYPSMARGEDTYVTERLLNSGDLISIDAPLTYVYVVTDKNTFDVEHHEKIVDRADYIATGDAYYDLIGILSDRIPIAEYRAEMIGRP